MEVSTSRIFDTIVIGGGQAGVVPQNAVRREM
jgi:cation diffusion facilitator CzcD-associated flavoprotein CzcO